MPEFTIIDKDNKIHLSDKWVKAPKFNSEGRIVDENGKLPSPSYKGRLYRLISKKERVYSIGERIWRGFLATVAIFVSLGFAWRFKAVKHLLTQDRAKIRFGEVIPSSATSQKNNGSIGQNTPSQVDQKKAKELKNYRISEKELNRGINISQETLSKIQNYGKSLLRCIEEDGITYYRGKSHHSTFSLDTAPDYIFRMNREGCGGPIGRDNSMKARYQKMVNAQTVCRTHQLGLLVIPRAKLFTVDVDGKECEIIAEKKLDITAHYSAQEQYFEEYASSLNETIRQLATFICLTGYSDVEWRKIPILNNSLNELGQRQLALIDIEEMDGKEKGLYGDTLFFEDYYGRRGLVGCVNEEQGRIVQQVAEKYKIAYLSFSRAYEAREKEIEEGNRLKEFYEKNNIITGYEPIEVDLDSLGLTLIEKASVYEGGKRKNITFKQVAEDVIQEMNQAILNNPKDASIKGKRYFLLNISSDPMVSYQNLPFQSEELDSLVYEVWEENIWVRKLINALVEKGHLFKLVKFNGHGYFIQA